MLNLEVCPACLSRKLHQVLGIERELEPHSEEETGRIRPVLKYVLCQNCGRRQEPVKVTPVGEWYYPASM